MYSVLVTLSTAVPLRPTHNELYYIEHLFKEG